MADIWTTRGLGNTTLGLQSGTCVVPKYIGWGTSSTAPARTDTDLVAAAAEARTSGTATQQTTTYTNDTLQVVGTITCAGAGKTITEVILAETAATATANTRSTFTGIPLNVGDSIAFTIKLALS